MSRSGKKLSKFEFKRQNIADCCKLTFHFQFNPKQNMIFSVFSEWEQKFKFLYTTGC